MRVTELVEKYLRWCAQNDRAENTIKHYQGRLKPLIEHLGERDFASIKPLEVSEYLAAAGEGKAPDTRRSNAVAFERLHNWALIMKIIDQPLIENRLEKPAPRLRDRVPTKAELRKLLGLADADFRLLCNALHQSGARPGELCGAQIEEVDFKNRRILIKHHKTFRKTQQPRKIVIGKKLEPLLRHAMGERSTGNVFLRGDGTPWTTNSASRMFSRLRDRAELSKDLCLYLLRHDHATQVCQKKGIHAAKDSLGHTNIKTTQRYLHTTDEELQDSQDLVE